MLTPGQRISGKYRIESVLGAGGMGVVYVAEHELLARRVALKTLHATSSADALERFRREAVALARVRSPHVAEALDADTLEDGTPYLVMELLDGRDLRAELRLRGPLPVGEAARYVAQACIGVGAAHAAGIVHRDLKPNNLFVARAGELRRVKVVDFGIAKFLDSGAHDLTNSQLALGTPLYMSPEHLRDPKNVGKPSDVWALGVVLYELLAGFSPFADETPGAIVAAVTLDEPILLSTVRPEVPVELAEVVHRVLKKDRRERTSSAEELRRALEPFAVPESELHAEEMTLPDGPRVVLPKPWPRRLASEVRREIRDHVDRSEPPPPVSGPPTVNERPGERLSRVPSLGLISRPPGAPRPAPASSAAPGPAPGTAKAARPAWIVPAITVVAAVAGGAFIANVGASPTATAAPAAAAAQASPVFAAPPEEATTHVVDSMAPAASSGAAPGVPATPTAEPPLAKPVQHRAAPARRVATPASTTATPETPPSPPAARDGNPLHL